MIEPISTSISVIALAVSTTTLWLAFFFKGTIKMTRPTTIFFGPDGMAKASPKVFLSTLLFSTARRGGVIESMHVALSRNESMQNFPIWVYGTDKLARGSGLFVGETGVATNHHFMTMKDNSRFEFMAGRYKLKVFAQVLGHAQHRMLFEQELEITPTHASELSEGDAGIYFDWSPETSRYLAHIDKRRRGLGDDAVIDIMKSLRDSGLKM